MATRLRKSRAALVTVIAVVLSAVATLAITDGSSAADIATVSVTVAPGSRLALVPTDLQISVSVGQSAATSAAVSVRGDGPNGVSVVEGPVTTNDAGQVSISVTPTAFGHWVWTATAIVDSATISSDPAGMDVLPAEVAVSLASPSATVYALSPATVTATVMVNGTAVAGVALDAFDDLTVVGSGVTDSSGRSTVSIPTDALRSLHLVARVSQGPAWHFAESVPVDLTVVASAVQASLSAVRPVVSERAFQVKATVTLPSGRPLAGTPVGLWSQRIGDRAWYLLARGVTGQLGTVSISTALWKPANLRVRVDATGLTKEGDSSDRGVNVIPAFAGVTFPRGAALPKVAYPVAPPPRGNGANARIGGIPDSVWNSMMGLSWHPGCVPRRDLRRITVNYFGFDGFRYGGELIVRADAAKATAAVFTRLYAIHYPIRSIFLPDRYGRHPYGPGANDYLSMAADNTYGFNCRYVVGKESRGIWSPHASGRAIDINTWENPYIARTGVFPDSWWLNRGLTNPAMMKDGSPTVRAFTDQGFEWGAYYGDYQHFQRN